MCSRQRNRLSSQKLKSSTQQRQKGKIFFNVIFFVSYFVSNLFCLTYLLTLIWLCSFCHPLYPPSCPPILWLSFTYPFFKSHLRLAGMSHRSSVPSGAAPVILRGHVHLSEQWIKKHSKDGIRGLSRKDEKQHLPWRSGFQQGTFLKVKGQRWPPPVIRWLLALLNGPGTLGHPPKRPQLVIYRDFAMRGNLLECFQ